MKKAIDIIIQARMDSERLPQKVVMPVAGKPLLAHIVERLSLSQYARRIILATTEDSEAAIRDALAPYPQVRFYIGSKQNVLERYVLAARENQSEIIVRATGDNPLVCPEFLDKAIDIHLGNEADLTHFIGIPLGTGVEVINRNALESAYRCTRTPYDLEHVTPFIYKNRDSFKVLEPVSTGLFYAPDLRVTVDTMEDIRRVRGVFDYYAGKEFIRMEDIVDYFAIAEKEEVMHAALA